MSPSPKGSACLCIAQAKSTLLHHVCDGDHDALVVHSTQGHPLGPAHLLQEHPALVIRGQLAGMLAHNFSLAIAHGIVLTLQAACVFARASPVRLGHVGIYVDAREVLSPEDAVDDALEFVFLVCQCPRCAEEDWVPIVSRARGLGFDLQVIGGCMKAPPGVLVEGREPQPSAMRC